MQQNLLISVQVYMRNAIEQLQHQHMFDFIYAQH